MASESSKKLEKTLRDLFHGVRRSSERSIGVRRADKEKGGNAQVEICPGCAFGALVEERLKNMERNLQEVKGRINGLIFLIVALVVAEVILRLF
ncbi:MAG: hypothetical protein IBX36_06095 [Dehalococcoidia bacterium]|nr:hypothetical protein [Dehalococcoidia bacterium]